MYQGITAIDYLTGRIHEEDAGASSHWNHYLSGFRWCGDGFEGARGFGGFARPYSGLRRIVHRILLGRFRRMGSRLPEFRAIDCAARELTSRQNRQYDLDVLRQTLTLAFVKEHAADRVSGTGNMAAVIGDGFGTLVALLLATGSAQCVVLVNLTKTLLVDLFYLKLWMGDKAFDRAATLVTDEGELAALLERGKHDDEPQAASIIAIEASNHHLLRECPLDIAFNIVSMQEMDPPVIAAYFHDLRGAGNARGLMFYCCNRLEKTLPDGTVTRFCEYPWLVDDVIMIDELCPWHQEYYATRPPFYRPYDGPIQHRLALLKQSESAPEA